MGVWLGVLIGLAQGAPGNAPREPDILRDVAACRAVASTSARLACYDRQVARMESLVDSRQVVVLDRAEIQKTRRGLFGFNIPDLSFFKRSGKDIPEEVNEITARVASASADGYGKYTVRLQDGAIWRTTEPVRTPPVAGGEVTIRRAALGSYMMRVGKTRGVRALRVN